MNVEHIVYLLHSMCVACQKIICHPHTKNGKHLKQHTWNTVVSNLLTTSVPIFMNRPRAQKKHHDDDDDDDYWNEMTWLDQIVPPSYNVKCVLKSFTIMISRYRQSIMSSVHNNHEHFFSTDSYDNHHKKSN